MGLALGPSNLTLSFFMERFGRRWVHAGANLMDAISWLLQYWATDLHTFLFARLLAGVSVASSHSSGSVIFAEYTDPEYRGIFLNVKTVAMFFGYMITHIMAHYINFRTIALMGAIPCALGFLCNLTWPESPSWLLKKNRFEECEEVFYWLRGRGDKAVKELEAMVRAQKVRMSSRQPRLTFCQKTRSFFDKFKRRSLLMPLSIVLCVMILKEASGKHFFATYALDIISQATNDKSNHFFYIILIDVISLMSTAISCILIKYMGRRKLFMLSGVPSIAVLIILSSLLFMISKGILIIEVPWLIPSLLCAFFITANLGCTTLPLVIFGEIFPLPYREIGIGVGGCSMSVTFFSSLYVMPYMLTYLELYGTFTILASIIAVGLLYLYFTLPETRNKTLQEIEDYFDHGRFLEDDDVEVTERMLDEVRIKPDSSRAA